MYRVFLDLWCLEAYEGECFACFAFFGFWEASSWKVPDYVVVYLFEGLRFRAFGAFRASGSWFRVSGLHYVSRNRVRKPAENGGKRSKFIFGDCFVCF
jgi:hypothetical protein